MLARYWKPPRPSSQRRPTPRPLSASFGMKCTAPRRGGGPFCGAALSRCASNVQLFSRRSCKSHRHASSSQAALKETHLELCGVVDLEQGGKKVRQGNTRESLRRRAATRAGKKCVAEAEAAVAAAQVDGNATLVAAAHAYSVAATDLRDAHPEKQSDAHISFRAAAASYRASVASAKAVGDDAAMGVAQKLVEASNAFDVAAKAVVDAVDFDTKLEARGDLEAAEDALKNLFSGTTAPTTAQSKPRARKTAHRPRPNTRTDRSRPTNASSHRRRAGRGSGVASARAASPRSAARASTAATCRSATARTCCATLASSGRV